MGRIANKIVPASEISKEKNGKYFYIFCLTSAVLSLYNSVKHLGDLKDEFAREFSDKARRILR